MTFLAASAALTLATSGGPTAAGEPSRWSFSVTEEGVARAWQDKPDTFADESLHDGMNRLYLLATRDPAEIGLQLDLAVALPEERAGLLPRTEPVTSGRTMVLDAGGTHALVLEKKFARYRGAAWSAELGDVYRSVGRGVALSVVRNTELDVDTSIEGAALDAKAGALDLGVWAGLSNPQTLSAGFRNSLRIDPRDRIGGVRAGVELGGVTVQGHAGGLQVDPDLPAFLRYEGEVLDVEDWSLASGSVHAPESPVGDLYLESSVARIRSRTGDPADPANEEEVRHRADAWYGALLTSVSRVSVLLEAKRYHRFELLNVRQGESDVAFDYSTPPTLEKEEVVTSNSTLAINSNDIAGGRVTLSGRALGGLLRARWLHAADWGHPARGVQDFSGNENVDHVTLGYELRKPEKFFQATVGARVETRHQDPDTHDLQLHADIDLLLPIAGFPVEVKSAAWRQTESSLYTGERLEYDVTRSVVSVRPVRWLAVAGILDTSNDESMIGGPGQAGNLSDELFGAVELTVEPRSGTVARLFAGSTEGGLKCSGGTCRIVPAFEGFRAEWLARF